MPEALFAHYFSAMLIPGGAWEDGNFRPLDERRENTVVKLFKEVCNDPNHKLYHLLPPPNQCNINLRRKSSFSVQKLNTDRLRNYFIVKNAIKSKLFFCFCFFFPTVYGKPLYVKKKEQ